MKKFSLIAPWFVVGLAAVYFAMRMMPPTPSEEGMDLQGFAGIMVQGGGRYKPLDTDARNKLMSLTHRQTVADAPSEEEIKAAKKRGEEPREARSLDSARRLLEMMTLGLIQNYETVTITDPEVLKVLGLEPDPANRFDLHELEPKFQEIKDRAEQAIKRHQKGEQLTPFERQMVLLYYHIIERYIPAQEMRRSLAKRNINPDRVALFRIENLEVLGMLGLKQRSGFRYSVQEIRQAGQLNAFISWAYQVAQREKDGEKIENLAEVRGLELLGQLKSYSDLTGLHGILMVPVAEGKWKTLAQGLEEMDMNPQSPEATRSRVLAEMLYAYGANKPELFNKTVAAYREDLATAFPGRASTSQLELFFNDFSPFYLCMVFYVIVLVLSCLAWIGWFETAKNAGGAEVATGWSQFWIGWRDTLNRTGFALAILVLLVHTWALGTRMYIMGRPPVTNLYSSAIFIGWGCVLLCLFLEWIYHNGIGTLVVSLTGFLTLWVAYHLDGGDTMEVLQAVLDTNFWLMTHVVCVTLGYTATFVAGFLGLAYITLGFTTPLLRSSVPSKPLANMIYGVVCFATLLSFVGTVLGGIWADQSWGRFWGWDPKENGALLIVIWNALILHARWGGIVKERGIAVLAVVGNMVTGWSWFGTNQLGVGLHAYGFNDKLATGLVIFWASQLTFIVLGCLPLRMWWSFAPQRAPVEVPPMPKPPHKGGPKLRPA